MDDGHTWPMVMALRFRGSRTIDRWVKRFHQEGSEAVTGHTPDHGFRFDPERAAVVIG